MHHPTRLAKWNKLVELRASESKSTPTPITIKYIPNEKTFSGISGKTTPMEIAKNISNNLVKHALIARINKATLWDLNRPLVESCTLEILDWDYQIAQQVFWHSSAHILGECLEHHFKAHLTFGPPLEDGGFFYDSHINNHIKDEDYPKIETTFHQFCQEEQPFERLELKKEEALDLFAYNPFKIQLINESIKDNTTLTAYRCGKLIDLCRGPHIPHTGHVKAFRVWRTSSVHWKHDQSNQMLQRVYGISFPTPKQLREWDILQKRKAELDHRKLGKDQELFFVHPHSPGSYFFLPHGTRIYNALINRIKREYRKRGFEEVISPTIYHQDLWKISGHAGHYAKNMFHLQDDYSMKPMNCPGHCLLFGHRTRSYRELPFRIADFSVLHRNELSGTLTGLTRVRRFVQDDAHIFCASDQIESEILNALDFIKTIYDELSLSFTLELSTRPEKYLGTAEQWQYAEKQLSIAIEKAKLPFSINEGDGAFYGPKIDIHATDKMNRSHQLATIQLDFNLPERFKLEFIRETSDIPERPVIIHRAVLGSVERMIAILIEHFEGKWPFWLSPRQACIIPVHQEFSNYAQSVRDALHNAGFYADHDNTNKTLQYKIRHAQQLRYNYILVVGAEEQEKHSVNVRPRDIQQHERKANTMLIPQLIKLFNDSKF